MNPKKPINNPIQEGLRLINQCPVCKGSYEPDESNILKEKGSTHLVHITCPHCHNSILAVVSATAMGLSSVGMVTDLKAGDVLRLYSRETITEDELLNFHQLLKTNKILNL